MAWASLTSVELTWSTSAVGPVCAVIGFAAAAWLVMLAWRALRDRPLRMNIVSHGKLHAEPERVAA